MLRAGLPGGYGLRADPLLLREQPEDVAAGAVAFCTCQALQRLCMEQSCKCSACWRGCLPAPRQGYPGFLPLNQVFSLSLRSLGARPTEMDTHQGEAMR